MRQTRCFLPFRSRIRRPGARRGRTNPIELHSRCFSYRPPDAGRMKNHAADSPGPEAAPGRGGILETARPAFALCASARYAWFRRASCANAARVSPAFALCASARYAWFRRASCANAARVSPAFALCASARYAWFQRASCANATRASPAFALCASARYARFRRASCANAARASPAAHSDQLSARTALPATLRSLLVLHARTPRNASGKLMAPTRNPPHQAKLLISSHRAKKHGPRSAGHPPWYKRHDCSGTPG